MEPPPPELTDEQYALALADHDPAALRAALDAGVSPDRRLHDGETPGLFLTLSDEHPERLALLLERGASANDRDTLGRTALVLALYQLQYDAANRLLDAGATPLVLDVRGVSFAWVLHGLLTDAERDSPAATRLAALRDRVVAMGVAWPPASPAVERDRLRAQGYPPVVPAGEQR